MKLTLIRENQSKRTEHDFEYLSQSNSKRERPMVLDVLLQAEYQEIPDLAYRYGCRNGLCGVCTVNVNGKPKLACRTKVRNGDEISAMSGLPVVRDLVVKREAINKQLRGRMPVAEISESIFSKAANASASSDKDYLSLNRCIECYACLDGCPLHEKNDEHAEEYCHGNPFLLLKLQKIHVDPKSSEDNKKSANNLAKELGLDRCVDCQGCRCGVGIDLKKEVVEPLLKNAALISEDDIWPTKEMRKV